MKIVINVCFGGFGLSDAAMHRYAELKGLRLYPEKGQFGLTTYWTKPKSERPIQPAGPWPSLPLDDRKAYNKAYSESTLYDRDIPRNDRALVQVAEELGEKASGRCAKLKIVEIPDDARWEISEYDGTEEVREVSRSWS